MPALNARNTEQIYMRKLPGGGFVMIEVSPMRTLFGARRYQGRLILERRSETARRDGHVPPVIAEAQSTSIAGIFHELFLLAQSNVALATAALRPSTLRGNSSFAAFVL